VKPSSFIQIHQTFGDTHCSIYPVDGISSIPRNVGKSCNLSLLKNDKTFKFLPAYKDLKKKLITSYVQHERWAGHVARMGEERGVYRVLAGKPEGRRPLGRPRRRWVNNIRMDLQVVGCGYMDWIGMAQDRDRWRTLVSVVMNLRVP